MTSYAPGTFCWVDLATFDTNAAKKFYNELFGWTPLDTPMGGDMIYTIMTINDKPVAALYEMMPQQREMNVPSNWLSYINVTNISDTLEVVRNNNGNILMDRMDNMDAGISAIIQDPEGAIVSLWEPKKEIGSAYWGDPGTLCWVEHWSHDNKKAVPFLEAVFGWKAKTEKMGMGEYTQFYLGENAVTGLFVLPEEMKDVPSNWLPYFYTSNIDASVEIILKNNGKVIMAKLFVEGVGYYGVFSDDQGAVFGLVQGEMK